MAEPSEDSLESTGRSPAPARDGLRWRGSPVPPVAARGGSSLVRVEDSDSSEEDAGQVARRRSQKLYRKVMLHHCVLASPEEREAMAEPTGWRPLLPPNLSLETQIRILRAKIDACIDAPPAEPSPTSSPPSPPSSAENK